MHTHTKKENRKTKPPMDGETALVKDVRDIDMATFQPFKP